MSVAAVVGALIGFTLGSSAAGEADDCFVLLQELESGAYKPNSLALEEALQHTRAYLQEHQ